MQLSSNTDQCKRPYYKNPTADIAIGNVDRERKETQKEQERELRKLLISDIKAVLGRAKEMEIDTVNFYRVPVKNMELILAALREYRR